MHLRLCQLTRQIPFSSSFKNEEPADGILNPLFRLRNTECHYFLLSNSNEQLHHPNSLRMHGSNNHTIEIYYHTKDLGYGCNQTVPSSPSPSLLSLSKASTPTPS